MSQQKFKPSIVNFSTFVLYGAANIVIFLVAFFLNIYYEHTFSENFRQTVNIFFNAKKGTDNPLLVVFSFTLIQLIIFVFFDILSLWLNKSKINGFIIKIFLRKIIGASENSKWFEILEKLDTPIVGNNIRNNGVSRTFGFTYLLLFILLYFMIWKSLSHFYLDDLVDESFFKELIIHIDVIGILTGIIGIILASLIAVFIERLNEKYKDEIYEKTTVNLAKAEELNIKLDWFQDSGFGKMDRMESLLDLVYRANGGFTVLPTYLKRLEEIDSLIAEVVNDYPENDIYFYNYNLTLGLIQAFEIKSLIEDLDLLGGVSIKPEDLKYSFEKSKFHRTNIKNNIKVMKKSGVKMSCFVLDDSNGENSNYFKFLINILKNRKIIRFNSSLNPDFSFTQQQIKTDNPIIIDDDIFNKLVSSYEIEYSSDLDLLVKYFFKSNLRFSKVIEEAEVGNIYRSKHIYVPFIVTKPSDRPRKNGKKPPFYKSIIMFNNLNSPSIKNYNIAAFSSIDQEVANNLISVFEGNALYAEQSIKRKSLVKNILLNKQPGNSLISFKSIPDTKLSPQSENIPLAYLSDIKCYFNYKDICTNYGYNPIEIFTNDAYAQYKQGQNKNFISIGLFGNEFFDELFGDQTPNIQRLMFATRPVRDENGEFVDRKPESTYFELSGQKFSKSETYEYGIFYRQTGIKNLTIVGGMTDSGTRRLGEWLKGNYSEFLNSLEELIPNSQSITIFEIPKEDTKPVKEVYYTGVIPIKV